MGKTSKAAGGTHRGEATDESPEVLARGRRVVLLDGALGFGEPGQRPDTWLTRSGTGTLVINDEQIGGATDTTPWVFNVKDDAYGAAGDGVTDDTAAINLAVSAATTYAAATEPAYAEIYFPVGVYLLSGALTQGGGTLGNAQIPLPIRAGTARKLTLVFKGAVDAAAHNHWQQTTPQRWGVTLRSTLTGQTVDGSHGAPSIIGGPTPQHGYGTTGGTNGFNNLLVVIDGIAVQAPLNPSVVGFDFRGIAEAAVINGAAIANATPAEMFATPPTHDWATGLLMPQNLNNHYCFIGTYSCQGFYLAFSLTEHTVFQRVTAIYCHDAMYVQADGNGNHASGGANLGAELCTNGIITDGSAPHGPVAINIGIFDCESVTNHIVDPNGALGGIVYYADNDELKVAPTIAANDAANLEVISARQDRGAVPAPSVPASTTALRNPFWRHAAVNIVGGTVTAIAVAGVATGLTSGTVIVPSGKTVTLTYSVTPTWVWTLL